MNTKLTFKQAEFKREIEEVLDHLEDTLNTIDSIAWNHMVEPLFRQVDKAKADLNVLRRTVYLSL